MRRQRLGSAPWLRKAQEGGGFNCAISDSYAPVRDNPSGRDRHCCAVRHCVIRSRVRQAVSPRTLSIVQSLKVMVLAISKGATSAGSPSSAMGSTARTVTVQYNAPRRKISAPKAGCP